MLQIETEHDLVRFRVGLALAAYESDTVRLANHSLAGATHLLSSRKGLYALQEGEWQLLVHGFFFGLTFRGSDIFAFESCDQPQNAKRHGRVIRLTRDGDRITGAKVLAKGLHNSCHQIDFLSDRLHVVDTHNQVILRFDERETSYETLGPLPRSETGLWPRSDSRYRHINSILRAGERNFLLLHNGCVDFERPSEIAVYDDDWQPRARWSLPGRGCHGLAVLEDGTLLTCDSKAGDVISANGEFRVHVSPFMTRGLAVSPEEVVVGASRLAASEDRLHTSGTVIFMDRDFSIRSVMEVPGAPMEIRRLDGRDAGLSTYLRQVGWGNNLREGHEV